MGLATAAGYGMSAAQSFAQYKQASVQYDMQEAARKENNRRAALSLASTYRSLEADQDQIRENAIALRIDAQKAAAIARGGIQAQAGAEGITGGAVSMSTRNVDVDYARAVSRTTMNRERELDQLSTQMKDAEYQYSSRLQLMPSQKPDPWSYVVSGLAQGFSMAQSFEGAFTKEKLAAPDKGGKK